MTQACGQTQRLPAACAAIWALLGYEVDFGHMEAVNLISSPKYSEKSVGYAWCALMLREGDELLRLIINSIRVDLISKQDNAVCLALNSICNVGGKEFAEALFADVLADPTFSKSIITSQATPFDRLPFAARSRPTARRARRLRETRWRRCSATASWRCRRPLRSVVGQRRLRRPAPRPVVYRRAASVDSGATRRRPPGRAGGRCQRRRPQGAGGGRDLARAGGDAAVSTALADLTTVLAISAISARLSASISSRSWLTRCTCGLQSWSRWRSSRPGHTWLAPCTP